MTPIGQNVASFWDSLLHGRSGIKPFQFFDISALPTRMAGQIPDFDAKKHVAKENRRGLKVMARGIQLAICAAQLAIDDGQVDKARLDPARFGVEFGAGLLPTELKEIGPASHVSANCTVGKVNLRDWGEKGIPVIEPLWMLKYLPNMHACHTSILHNAQGPNNSITEGDVGGLLAMGEAFRIIRRDQADFFLVGGADSKMNPLSQVRQCLFGHLSLRNETPEKACRPFDKNRDGLVIGEGSTVMTVEELDHARQRGAKIYGEVVGVGSAFGLRTDRFISAPGDTVKKATSGLTRAAQAAMKQAGIGPEDLDHVNAHGLGTQAGDALEVRCLMELFGSAKQPVSILGLKGFFGNMGAGSGPTELAASLLALKHGQVPGTLNCDEPDVASPLTVIQALRPLARRHVLKIGYNDLGQCAAVVVRKWEG
jgi:3-oxoacyl-[acyl-carrier-protein] synthase II